MTEREQDDGMTTDLNEVSPKSVENTSPMPAVEPEDTPETALPAYPDAENQSQPTEEITTYSVSELREMQQKQKAAEEKAKLFQEQQKADTRRIITNPNNDLEVAGAGPSADQDEIARLKAIQESEDPKTLLSRIRSLFKRDNS